MRTIGSGRRGSTVRWGMAGHIALGWVLTLPAAGIMGAFAAGLALLGPIGIVLDVIIGSIVVATIYWWSRSTRVSHHHLLHDMDDAGHVVRITKTPRKPTRKERQKVAL